MPVSQAFIFYFKWYSLLHFAVCQLLCWSFLFNGSSKPQSSIDTHTTQRGLHSKRLCNSGKDSAVKFKAFAQLGDWLDT